MITIWISGILTRDLRALRRELEAYPSAEALWRLEPGITNPGGNLALHLTGNLRHFIGAVLGGSGYVRNRDAEFNRRDPSRGELLAEVDAAIVDVERGLAKVSDADLAKPFPQPVAGVTVSTGDFLIHLAGHLTYHLGQLDYHRRLLTARAPGSAATIGAVSPAELKTAKPAAK